MRKHLESKLQRSCVKWFDLQYPKMRQLLFAIPNGGARSKIEAGIMKGEGVRAGVADMFLAVPSSIGMGDLIPGLFIEFKHGKGKQTDSQKEFEKVVLAEGYSYKIVAGFDHFRALIENYLPYKSKSSSLKKQKAVGEGV